ncbi:MAG TPA: DUF4352 domain-containing protein [Candidatus Saccharimonadales bacterium]|nr:DUF4352 domain-containing protein [Candidatus Saccharimonadales bacterium]
MKMTHWTSLMVGVLAASLLVACGGTGGVPASGSASSPSPGATAKSSPSGPKIYAVGSPMTFQGLSVTVLSFKLNYSTGNEFDVPAAGNEYVQVTYSLSNGSGSEWTEPLFDLSLVDANGQKYNSAFVTAGTSSVDSLVAGGKAPSATQVYEVPAGSVLDVVWTPNMFESTTLQTALK